MASESDHRIVGRAFPPHSAHETPATLVVAGERVALIDAEGETLLDTTRAETRPERALGGTERRVHLPGGATFLTRDDAALDAALPAPGGWLPTLERADPITIATIAVACLAGAYALFRWGLTALVVVAVWLTPQTVAVGMDRGTMPLLDRVLFEETRLPADRRAEVRALYAETIAHGPPPRRGTDDRLLFRRMDGLPNALALPGGTVVVTDELVRMLESDADALAGVLAHEIAHVRERHGLHGLYRAVGISVMVALMAGETGPILEEALLEGNVLLALAGSRHAEREADAGAVATLRAMGRDPEGLARFFDEIGARHGDGGGWASTHPGSAERAETIRGGPAR